MRQPLKYFECSCGIEQGACHAQPGDEVVSASVQSLARRLDRFAPDDFDVIICDEAHHAAAGTYRRIFDHFKPRLLLGFTATPNRADQVRLNDVFSDIIFDRDLKVGNSTRISLGHLLPAREHRVRPAPGQDQPWRLRAGRTGPGHGRHRGRRCTGIPGRSPRRHP